MHTDSAPQAAGTWGTGWWQGILLGMVLILAGLFILWDAIAATAVSAIVFGIALLTAGLFEILLHGAWWVASGWTAREEAAPA